MQIELGSGQAGMLRRPSRHGVDVVGSVGDIASSSPAPVMPDRVLLPAVPRPFFNARPLRFGGLIEEDYHMELRSAAPINPNTTSTLLQGLLVRNAIKKAINDSSTLKLFLDSDWTDWFAGTSRAALADVFRLVDRPVDVVVRENLNDLGMLALQSATGKRLMYEGAMLALGPVQEMANYQRNDDHAVDREWSNEYVRDLEYAIMKRAGVRSRAKLYWQDLNGAAWLNALQALAYGQKGLVDAVVVKFDRVVTREDLDRYLAQQELSDEKKREFLSNHLNIRKIPSRTLAEFSPRSIPPKADKSVVPSDVRRYRSWREIADAHDQKKYQEEQDLLIDSALSTVALLAGEQVKTAPLPASSSPNPLTFYKQDEDGIHAIPFYKVPLGAEARMENTVGKRIFMSNLSESRGLLEDDLIYFNDAFVDESARQVTRAIGDLDRKKRQARMRSNIKILVNSPGGSIASGLDIRSAIQHSKTKVDVMVTGMAASCGAFLVASATGNRLATPNARLMIHDAWWSDPPTTHKLYNQSQDTGVMVTRAFADAIAQASGRPFNEVWQDIKMDVWLNPLEAMFYGKKGLVDAILVGDNKAITRADVRAYLHETLGGEKATNQYLRERLKSLRVGRLHWKPEDHNERDPFDNPLKTIEAVAKKAARDIGEIPELADSVPRPVVDVDQRVVTLPPEDGQDENAKSENKLSARSQKIIQAVRNWFLGRPRPV